MSQGNCLVFLIYLTAFNSGQQPVTKVNNFTYWLNAFGAKAGRKFKPDEVNQVFNRLDKSLKLEAMKTPIDVLPAGLVGEIWEALEGWRNCPRRLRHMTQAELLSNNEIRALTKKNRPDNFKHWLNLFEEKAGRKKASGEGSQGHGFHFPEKGFELG